VARPRPLSKREMERFFGYRADDVVLHFPGRGAMAGDYRGKDELGRLFQHQAEMLDSPPEIATHDVLANDEHAVVLNAVRASRGGRIMEQEQVVVMFIRDGRITETRLHFSDQQTMDEIAPS